MAMMDVNTGGIQSM